MFESRRRESEISVFASAHFARALSVLHKRTSCCSPPPLIYPFRDACSISKIGFVVICNDESISDFVTSFRDAASPGISASSFSAIVGEKDGIFAALSTAIPKLDPMETLHEWIIFRMPSFVRTAAAATAEEHAPKNNFQSGSFFCCSMCPKNRSALITPASTRLAKSACSRVRRTYSLRILLHKSVVSKSFAPFASLCIWCRRLSDGG
mmetsp:Transcript_1557/g.3031  ORF Transcript_1557/g.3031 Transcript_1557/m.3031 type:complete len:209 (-) Transcript_1557:283-909(-)